MIEAVRFEAGDEERAARLLGALLEGETPAERLRRFLADENDVLIGAHWDGEPVGFLVAYRLQRLDRERASVYLYDILVRDEFRRRGAAKAMVRRLHEVVEYPERAEIWVGSGRSNRAACALWEALGARRISEEYVEFLFESAEP